MGRQLRKEFLQFPPILKFKGKDVQKSLGDVFWRTRNYDIFLEAVLQETRVSKLVASQQH